MACIPMLEHAVFSNLQSVSWGRAGGGAGANIRQFRSGDPMDEKAMSWRRAPKDHVNTGLRHCGSWVQERGILDIIVCWILVFMWSFRSL